jgi:hypothetical protein
MSTLLGLLVTDPTNWSSNVSAPAKSSFIYDHIVILAIVPVEDLLYFPVSPGAFLFFLMRGLYGTFMFHYVVLVLYWMKRTGL